MPSMASTLVRLDTRRIRDRESFHDVFAEAMGFPDFYGRNMDAWIDGFTHVDEPDSGLTSVHAPPGGVLVLQLDHMDDLAERCPDLYDAIIECSAFVNYRRIEGGREPVLVLSFWKS